MDDAILNNAMWRQAQSIFHFSTDRRLVVVGVGVLGSICERNMFLQFNLLRICDKKPSTYIDCPDYHSFRRGLIQYLQRSMNRRTMMNKNSDDVHP